MLDEEEDKTAKPEDTTTQETQEEEAPEQEEEEGEEEEAPKKKARPWFQARIDEVTQARRAAEQERDQAIAALAEARKSGVKGEQLSEEEIDKRAAAKAAQIAEAKLFDKKCNDVYNKGKDQFDDFDDAVATLKSAGATQEFYNTVTELPKAAEVMKALGDDPDRAARIMRMSPTAMAVELARIEGSLGAKKPEKKVSNAADPINPVNGSGVNDDPEKMSMDDWLAWRGKNLDKKRGTNARR